MDGFTYTDIFETKGIEYLIIIAFLIILIPFWIIINKGKTVITHFQKVLGVLTAQILRVPQGLFYSKNHTWAYLEKSGNAKVGLDDFLLQIVGNVNMDNLKNPGTKLKKGELLAEVDQNGKRLMIYSPITGEIIRTNDTISENPEIMIEDPYEKGWIYIIKPSNWKTETNTYFLAEEATKWMEKELERFKDFLTISIGKHASQPSMVALQEGGELRQNVLSELDHEIWEDFQESFLN
jgi:glycine cleavage system H protein